MGRTATETSTTDTGDPHAVVTGGAGFIGSHLVEHLVEAGFDVTIFDNLATGRRENVAHLLDGRVRLVEHDVRNPLPSLVPTDLVFHLASRASPTDFDRHPVEIATTNAVGTQRVFDAALDADARVVIASTSEVYGDPEVHPQHESYLGNVDPRGPRAPYDEGKRFAEALSVAYADAYGLDVRTARIFNTYGPRMRPDDGRVVPTFVTQALRGEELTVHGDGTQTRSFCYVTDLVEGLYRLGTAEELTRPVNLGSTDEIEIQTLAKVILDVTDSESALVHEDRPTGDPDRRRPDLDRAKRHLGWEPSVTLRDGLARTVADFRERTVAQ